MKYIYGATAIVNAVAMLFCFVAFVLGFFEQVPGHWYYLIGTTVFLFNLICAVEAWDRQD